MPVSWLDDIVAASRASAPVTPIPYGPWEGSMRSVTADLVPRGYASGGSNFLFVPRLGLLNGLGYWRRRGGQTQKFDTFGASAGLLPAKWGARSRWSDAFKSESISDGQSTLMTLLTREDVLLGVEDGRFSQIWIRDQVNSLNYTLGDEFGVLTYPDTGVQSIRFSPLWHEHGDGGISRGTTEFERRLLLCGSRRFLKVANYVYHPSRFGTPSRWRGRFTPSTLVGGGSGFHASSTFDLGAGSAADWGLTPLAGPPDFGTGHDNTATNNAGTSTIFINNLAGGNNPECQLQFPTLAAATPLYTVRIWARQDNALNPGGTVGAATFIRVRISVSDSDVFTCPVDLDLETVPVETTVASASTPFTAYDFLIDTTGTPGGSLSGASRLGILFSPDGAAGYDLTFRITEIEIFAGLPTENEPNELIPSGPIPPTHPGTLSAGAAIAASTLLPDADVTDGAFLGQDGGASLFSYIDDTSDGDYIQSTTANDLAEVGVTTPSIVPTAGDLVTMRARFRNTQFNAITLTLGLYAGGVLRASVVSGSVTFLSGWVNLSYTLTDAEIAAVTGASADWSGVQLRFTITGDPGAGFVQISQARIDATPVSAQEGGWRGKDRFFFAVAYRFEDDSVWATTTPRFPNDINPSGVGFFTVDAANPEGAYKSILWSHLPKPPPGVSTLVLCRTDKIDSTIEDDLILNPYELKIVAEVAAGVTEYEDFFADDLSLTPDPERLIIRFDHEMPPRASYIAGGDMRVIHAKGGENPSAIELAPLGWDADYDRNLAADDANAYTLKSLSFYVTRGTGTDALVLRSWDGAAATEQSLAFSTYATLQELVDRINASSTADAGKQWRAQLCPGVDPQAPSATALTPHLRRLTLCNIVSGSPNIDRPTGGLLNVPIGSRVSSAPSRFTAAAYVVRIISDTQLVMSENASGTSSAITVDFLQTTGDLGSTGLAYAQRVIANAHPGFAYLTKSYLDGLGPIQKSTIWMTVASPLQAKSAANCFSNKISNSFTPPGDPGISMGGAGIGQGFVVPFSRHECVIRNRLNNGTGEDKDYRLYVLKEGRGCIAWNTVGPGDDFVPYLTQEGFVAADLDQIETLTEPTYAHALRASAARGDFSYEAPLAKAATDADNDGAYANARVMMGAIFVNYRASGSHPNRQVVLDYAAGGKSTGLEALFRSRGVPWGWSLPLVRSVTAMCEGVRSDGAHLYGWNDENAGSTGDGRVDEIETGDTDNGTAIAASVEFPYERATRNEFISGLEFTLNHLAPAGATVFLDYYRSFEDDLTTYTLATSVLTVLPEFVFLTQPARAVSAAVRWAYRQTGGGAAELRPSELRLKVLPRYK